EATRNVVHNKWIALYFGFRYTKVAELIEAQRTKYADFELIKVIGQGGFGRVELVRHKRTRRVYAIKMMSKQHLLDHSQSGYWEERDVMVKASSEWLVACHHAFLDKDNVYLCMEYMPGGDLYYWMEKYDTFNETQVRFYLAETILALEVLHGLRFIHRDLKPDNMLLDARGHLKLADFGSCVRLGEDGYHLCNSPIGTPDYISPEMLNCQSKAGKVGPECDWWALGVIAFEMLFGEPAFYGQSLVETYSRILAHEKSLTIPADSDPISPALEQFIRALLKPASTRLGSLAVAYASDSTVTDSDRAIALATAHVKAHPFFSGMAWHQLRLQDAPIQPVVNSETDTSNINFDETELQSDSFGSAGSSKLPQTGGAFSRKPPVPAYFTGNNLSFAGYTFNRDHLYLRTGLRGTSENQSVTTESNHKALTECSQRAQALQTEVNELQNTVQTLEKQMAMDQVTLKDTQRRLEESTAELGKSKATSCELEKMLTELRLRCSVLQPERDRLTSEIANVKTQLKAVTDSHEAERLKVSQLVEDKTSLSDKIVQLQAELQEAKIKVHEQMKSKEQLLSVSNADYESRQRELMSSLGAQIESLQAENREARQKATVLMTEASNLARNHAKQVNELTDQLNEAQRFCQLYQGQCKELNDNLEAAKQQEQKYLEDLTSMHVRLDMANSSRRTVEDRLLSTESTLAATKVELRSLQELVKNTREQANVDVARLTDLAEQRLAELDDVSRQLDEMRLRCTTAEEDSTKLAEQVSKLEKERELQQRNMKAIVDKLLHEVEGRMTPAAVRKRAKEHDIEACQQLAKNYKNLQSTSEKDKANMQLTIDQYKRDLADRNGMIATLTEECRNKDQDIVQLNALITQLYARLDQTTHAHSTPVKLNPSAGAGDASDMTILSNPSSTRNSQDLSMCPALSAVARDEIYTKTLEQIVDLDSKGRGRKKLIWLPKYAVLKPFVLALYVSRGERESGMYPVEEILLCRVLHVRKATAADLIHAEPEDIKRTLQFFYHKDDSTSSNLYEASEFDPNSTTASVRTTVGSSSAVSSSADEHVHWLEHTFQHMRFRIGTVLCEVCNRPCSELRNPPRALECIKCRMRIHWEHVDQHQKFVPCHNATEVRYIRLPNVQEQAVWLDHMNRLIHRLRELQQNPEKLLESSLSGVAAKAGGVAQIGSISSVEPFYRSIRASSTGPSAINSLMGSIQPPRPEVRPSFHSSFKKKHSKRASSPKSPPRSLSPKSLLS
ncbi:hypothetical protein EG68_07382, partial [Paragonimus skrjabini miyazakii]